MNQSALMQFTSHIQGKNAKVTIYPDRVEWTHQGRVTMTRALGGALLTGSLRKGGASEMIPIRAITSVTTKRAVTNTVVSVIAPGNSVDFKVSHAEADRVKSTILQLMAG